jgi:hypothetical protein
MNDLARISLRIERAGAALTDDGLLEAATRALREAQANLNHPSLQAQQTLTQDQVVALSSTLASEAWDADELPGEAPMDLLHKEFSAWVPVDRDSERIPWLILAADVLDWAALLMAANDTLVVEVKT